MEAERLTAFLARMLVVLVTAVLVTACGGSPGPGVRVFAVTLSGAEEVPPNASTAIGTGLVTVDLDSMTMTASIVTTGIADTAAAMQAGAVGVNGPVLLPLARVSGSPVWTGGAMISNTQLRALRSGADYFNVSSAAFPNGELRAQIIEQWPTDDEWNRLQAVRSLSPQLDQQMWLVEHADDLRDWHGWGWGFGFTLGF